jgi:hypothetical protein
MPAGSGLESAAFRGLPAGQRKPNREKLGGMRLWHCRACGAGVWSYDEPWTYGDDPFDRIHVTALECGGGMAQEDHLADCDAELVRQVLDP